MWLLALKKFWPFIVGALLLLAIYAWHRDKVSAAYDRGVADTEEAQALVIAKVKLENEKRETAIKLESVRLQTELEGKTRESELVASSLRDKLSLKRVCLSDRAGSSAPSETARSTAVSASPAEGLNAPQDVGSRIIEIVTECQHSTDKLVSWQAYFATLKANGF